MKHAFGPQTALGAYQVPSTAYARRTILTQTRVKQRTATRMRLKLHCDLAWLLRTHSTKQIPFHIYLCTGFVVRIRKAKAFTNKFTHLAKHVLYMLCCVQINIFIHFAVSNKPHAFLRYDTIHRQHICDICSQNWSTRASLDDLNIHTLCDVCALVYLTHVKMKGHLPIVRRNTLTACVVLQHYHRRIII